MEETVRFASDQNEYEYGDVLASPLIALLGHENGWVRHHARQCLVAFGESAVNDLVEALKNANEDVRWEAAKALGQIEDVRAANALVRALNDKNFGVRWLAAECLVHLGYDVLSPLLQELIEHSDAIWLRQSAHHVLHDLVKKKGFFEQVTPVLEALEGPEPALKVPIVAKNLLETMTEKQSGRKR